MLLAAAVLLPVPGLPLCWAVRPAASGRAPTAEGWLPGPERVRPRGAGLGPLREVLGVCTWMGCATPGLGLRGGGLGHRMGRLGLLRSPVTLAKSLGLLNPFAPVTHRDDGGPSLWGRLEG